MGEEIDFHSKCALAELQLASRSTNPEDARAHLARSSLHLQSMKQQLEIEARRR
jgi:hypothetical protein